MSRKIKLIWDMHGPHAQKTAEHHAIHLEEFANKENLKLFGCASERITPSHTIAYMVVEEDHMIKVRDALRPQRAEEAE